MFSIIKMPDYDYLDEEYDIVLTKQKGNSKGKNVESKRVKGEKKKEKNKGNPYNSKFVRNKIAMKFN